MTIQARPTVYRGISMRSRLEAHWAEGLDRVGWPWEYEPMAFADETGQYLPDFRIGGWDYYAEVKGQLDIADLPSVLDRMEIIQSSVPDAILVLAVGSPLDGGVVQLMKDGPADWRILDTNRRSSGKDIK